MGHNQNRGIALPFNATPKATGQTPGRQQFIPVRQRCMPAKKNSAYQQIMFLYRKEGGFLRILVKYAGTELFHGMQGRSRLAAGSMAVFLCQKR